MARRRKSGGGGGGEGWLVTFSDLMTLLLTFFVLLLSMSSMDQTLISRISAFSSNVSPISVSGPGRVPDRIRMVLAMLRQPASVLEKQDRIKDLLFPNDILPPELDAGTLKENLRILEHPEGVVLVLSDSLLFTPGSAEIPAKGRAVLEALTPLLHYSSADLNIAGHTDDEKGDIDNYTLSAHRSLAVLEFFLERKFAASRFSISAYGPDRPLDKNDTTEGRTRNRRVELLLKTTQWLGRYV